MTIFTKEIIYQVNEMKEADIKKDLPYGKNLAMDIYYPKDMKESLKPAVILITGYPDPGFKALTGYYLKEVAQYISWARLMAVSGFIAITYTNEDPVVDIHSLLTHIINNSAQLGIDPNYLGIWACSGNVPNAMSLLLSNQYSFLKCAVFVYGYMPDIGSSTITAKAAQQFQFVNPCSSLSTKKISWNTPVLIIRSGKDEMPDLNTSIDQFVSYVLSCNLPFSLINLPNAPHAFDLMDGGQDSREAIKNIILFIKSKLNN